MSGKVVHFELPYDDGERARQFYVQAFGWNLMPMPDMEYTIVSTGPMSQDGQPTGPGYINGGMLARSQSAGSAPVVVVDVEDINSALAAVEAAGGSTVAGRTAVGDMGFTAYVTDTEGNVIGLWQTAAG